MFALRIGVPAGFPWFLCCFLLPRTLVSDCMGNKVDFARFRDLLQEIENSDITIRVRVLGNPWTSFCTLILLSESAMILLDSTDSKIIINLKNIVEFELEEEVRELKANTVYEVGY